jgi:UDP-N-acetylmuramoyl-L-alanyl-D-glutamate--2,6-diaminopimelate ligase
MFPSNRQRGAVRLSDLIDDARVGDFSFEVKGLTADSRQVRPGFLFAALPGNEHDGRDFITQALDDGAVAVLAPPGTQLDDRRAVLIIDANPRRRLARLAARFFGRQPAHIAAVTGTNGKTSVARFTEQLWASLGHQGASLGTLGLSGASLDEAAALTTPDPVALHRSLAGLADQGVSHLVMEASSHGLDQYRLDGVDIAAAAFTNLSQDHLDYHRDEVSYLAAKQRLFSELLAPGGWAVLNADVPEFETLRAICRERDQHLLSYGRRGGELRLVDQRPEGEGQILDLDIEGRRQRVHLPLVGGFQADNALCALGLVLALGAPADKALAALEHLQGVPGRLEKVAVHASGAPVYVDYAHTPDALAHALTALTPQAANRLVVVFGCGGNRDRAKRPLMGNIACRLADRVIVTDDNPRGEDPGAIRRAVLEGCDRAVEVHDRGVAIRAAVSELNQGDVLMIAGKGHERGQLIGHEMRPFDDAQEARQAVSACSEATP